MSAIDAQSIVDVMKDAFLCFHIPLAKQCGQCYDGCSTMTGAKAGVAAKIEEMEPRAVHRFFQACAQPQCQRHHQAVMTYERLPRHLW